jgi:hypothetical protein
MGFYGICSGVGSCSYYQNQFSEFRNGAELLQSSVDVRCYAQVLEATEPGCTFRLDLGIVLEPRKLKIEEFLDGILKVWAPCFRTSENGLSRFRVTFVHALSKMVGHRTSTGPSSRGRPFSESPRISQSRRWFDIWQRYSRCID